MTEDTRFDILEQVKESKEDFEEDIEEENERYKNRRKIHKERKNEYEQEYKEQLKQVMQRSEVNKLITLAGEIEELNHKKAELMDDIKQIFFTGVNSFVDGRRATGKENVTVKDGGIHSYGKQKNTELSLGAVVNTEESLKAAMKTTDRYEDFLDMWNTLQKFNIGASFKIENVTELEAGVQFLGEERKYIEYSARYPYRVDIMQAEVYEEGKYRRNNRFQMEKSKLTRVSEREPQPQNLQAVLRFHDKIEQVMQETKKDCKEQLQEYKDLKQELAKPAQSAVLAQQL